MAIFNSPQSPAPKREGAPAPAPGQPESALPKEPTRDEFSFGAPKPAAVTAPSPTPAQTPRAAEREGKESVIAADLSIEGKINGAGHIRIAGRFKGDVQVDGDLTVEVGAKVNGGVRARKVVIAGELEGNVESAQRVELLEGGVVVGDVKAGVVSIAPGSRMRGQVDFGFDDRDAKPSGKAEKADKTEKNEAKSEASTAS
ncbi:MULTISPECIES: polymer-forming cytoskeletal protein [unclassified Lysobacter]|uniref:bactofilin family protein n=1 Tax=unclassified Lysobacter TaxID=2635362 RepID=UPI001C232252|nr:polymer-forming cytoskeletal protein [Lysobacter sp. MMG2]MBU8976108.1 polymer-forming cytoskeletal protein [Lysobacter sp. MMG2]